MDLDISGKTFAVGGASSGLGRAIAEKLIQEGATVIGVARSQDKLSNLAEEHGEQFIAFPADLSDSSSIRVVGEQLIEHKVSGCVFNAGGPPPGTVFDLSMEEWDNAYATTLRWKIQLTKALLPMMRQANYGTLLFIESVSIKQPIDNLVLSNAFRAAVAGFVKTLTREEGPNGISANILAPGYHATTRITTVLEKAAALQDISKETVEKQFLAEVPLGRLGKPEEFAEMAAFLLSPAARFISGQTISVDGGMTRFITG
ncbi:3-oxoacyl-[acyl-carrier protein] reductase [Lewinella aquimaris]|uniref:3-oxoacyl-[acyl-carrier protein] reductase n=1 Tax=Neolewinella aquimaris TaxID=1835722 RepID=A0A840DWL7_9BACT|nr:SDR family oxidoreductase [Neolewinella aquimaris]MBB4077401.1 3-oxoacyl-[acyl-carrier protein] reductase [Neolewinella aquimaris]